MSEQSVHPWDSMERAPFAFSALIGDKCKKCVHPLDAASECPEWHPYCI